MTWHGERSRERRDSPMAMLLSAGGWALLGACLTSLSPRGQEFDIPLPPARLLGRLWSRVPVQ